MSRRLQHALMASTLVLLANALVACQAIRPAAPCDEGTCEAPAPVRLSFAPKRATQDALGPRVSKHPSMQALAHDLDHLERHIDIYGSVTAKGPDIWGEARLTRDREAIDIEMSKEIDQFKARLQGKLTRSDQAILESATALSIIAAPQSAGALAGALKPTTFQAAPLVEKSRTQTQTILDGKGNVVSKEERVLGLAEKEPDPKAPPADPTAPPADDAKALIKDPGKLERNKIPAPKIPTIGGYFVDDTIGIEPTEYLNQKKRYLDYLTQLRRQNEGDDTADSPGYSMNLFRIPVSVMPGKRTDSGHGAEVTFTINPVLSDELLPTTFRTLSTNDLVNQIGFPLTKMLEPASRDGQASVFSDENRLYVRYLFELQKIIPLSEVKCPTAIEKADLAAEMLKLPSRLQLEFHKYLIEEYAKEGHVNFLEAKNSLSSEGKLPKAILDKLAVDDKHLKDAKEKDNLRNVQRIREIAKSLSSLNNVTIPFSTGTRGRQAIPFSQYVEVFGGKFLFEVGYRARQAMAKRFQDQGYAHLPDVQGFLKMEIDAAYRALKNDKNQLMEKYCDASLVKHVLDRDYKRLEIRREEFRADWKTMLVPDKDSSNKEDPEQQPEYSSSAALAWMLIVQSAMLNDRLIQDMKEVAAAKKMAMPSCGEWPHYFLPNPSPEVRQAFKDYVAARWPIHVFALDPAVDEQNIADSLTLQREHQFALSVAFTSGRINANQFSRSARRLESQYDTVALNRTQIGFSHGDNIFGWRFTPRFQSPPTKGNLTTVFRDQLLGAPLLPNHSRKLEAGPRECVALVIMPSFVPYVNVEVASNWYCLDNPKHVLFNHVQAMNLSQTVQAIRTNQCAIGDSDRYRDGDLGRLVNRAEQLSARLPLQSMTAQVPVQTTLGGFEMFVNGTTDLAPELSGWYGAPGIDPNNPTTLFLVGDHFSVTQSKVLSGNRAVLDKKMISRQVMQITVPAGALPTKNDCVQINVATPYGVSQDLLVPILRPAKPPVAASATLSNSATVVYKKAGDSKGEGKYELIFGKVAGNDGAFVQWPADAGSAPAKANLIFTFLYNDCPIAITLEGLAPTGNQYHLDKGSLATIVCDLFRTLNTFGPFNDASNPLKAAFVTKKIEIVPVEPEPKADRKPSANQIELKFECSIK